VPRQTKGATCGLLPTADDAGCEKVSTGGEINKQTNKQTNSHHIFSQLMTSKHWFEGVARITIFCKISMKFLYYDNNCKVTMEVWNNDSLTVMDNKINGRHVILFSQQCTLLILFTKFQTCTLLEAFVWNDVSCCAFYCKIKWRTAAKHPGIILWFCHVYTHTRVGAKSKYLYLDSYLSTFSWIQVQAVKFPCTCTCPKYLKSKYKSSTFRYTHIPLGRRKKQQENNSWVGKSNQVTG
jgi:hypothetical protein